MTAIDIRLQNVARASIAIAVLVMGLKYYAYALTGSVALYSDALESIVNVMTAMIALYAVTVAGRPADRQHPFGHHKAEYFAAVAEGVLIIVAALLILSAAYDAMRQPVVIERAGLGLLVNAAAALVNAGWAAVLIALGRRHASPALAADGWHLVTDVVTSVAVLAGLVIAGVTGWRYADPALAVFVALSILWAGAKIVRGSLSGLMDEAVAVPLAAEIRALISEHATGAIEVHDLKTRSAGRATFIEFHLVVPGTMTVAAAHAICDRIEDALRARVAGAQVLIHVEPEGEAKQTGVVVV